MNVAGRPNFKDTVITLPEGASGKLDRVLRDAHPGASWADVRRLVETGKVRVDDQPERDPQRLVRGGAKIEISMTARKRESSSSLPRSALVHVDSQLVVVQKPAGISTVPYDENEAGTLLELVQSELGRREAPLGVVHRIDKETSGLVVFARTLAAKRALKNQFRFHTVHRRYRALAHGALGDRTFSTRLVQDRGDGRRGSTENPKLGRVATTHVRLLEALGPASLLECELETGRTHQIRIHLAEAGHPLLGERVYSKGFRGTLLSAPRLMLHAQELGFSHPQTEQPLRFEQAMPEDMIGVIEALRRQRH